MITLSKTKSNPNTFIKTKILESKSYLTSKFKNKNKNYQQLRDIADGRLGGWRRNGDGSPSVRF